MTAAILTIGTEVTRGELIDTNSAWLSDKLSDLGWEVVEKRSVDDDMNRIVSALQELSSRHQVLIVTGGLGPTSDDLTSAAAAQALGSKLIRDPAVLQGIHEFFARHGRVPHPMNDKQADFPEGARVLPNPRGTAPGFALRMGRSHCFFTPGVPSEMRGIYEESIEPSLPPAPAPVYVRRLTCFAPESEIAGAIAALEARFPITLAYRATAGQVEVKVTGRLTLGQEARSREPVDQAWAEAQSLLSRHVVVEGRKTAAQILGEMLAKRNLKLALAESCTGGLVSKLITDIPGSSQYYLGSVTSYDNAIKQKILGVPGPLLAQFGAVSRPVAEAMAEGVRKAFEADVALSITGIAGPGGGTEEKPVGLVHWAVALPNDLLAFEGKFRGERSFIQQRAASAALLSAIDAVSQL
jgi:nicotinamide-nucleotide amidase